MSLLHPAFSTYTLWERRTIVLDGHTVLGFPGATFFEPGTSCMFHEDRVFEGSQYQALALMWL